jgi:ABC-2 type transport system ATP-binding protein
MAVDCLHLNYRYGQFTTVDDLTLQVRPGETMGLRGPNGVAPVQQGELHIWHGRP